MKPRFGLMAVFLACVLGLVSISGPAQAVGTFSEGYRMGLLTKFSLKGYVVSTGEGELLLGRESTPYAETSQQGGKNVTKSYNPWRFSADKAMAPAIERQMGQYVWMRYRQEMFNVSIKDTDYRILEVEQVTRQDPSPAFLEVPKDSSFLARSEGARVGRIVKASRKGNLVKTWEIILQLGNSGGQFLPMSITEESLYDYAVAYLKSGRLAKVSYIDKGLGSKVTLDMEDTPYRIYRIELVNDL